MDEVLADLSDQAHPRIPRVSRRNDGFSRSDVVNAFQSAFEIIGGINRLAIWGNANPDKFYPLYAKLLPSTTQLIGDAGALEIIHRIAPTALDRHDPVTFEDGVEVQKHVEAECRELSSNTSPESISSPFIEEITGGAFSSRTGEPERRLPPSMT